MQHLFVAAMGKAHCSMFDNLYSALNSIENDSYGDEIGAQ